MSYQDQYPLLPALQYENEVLLAKFKESYDFSDAEIQMVFLELKKWLWLRGCALFEQENGVLGQKIEFMVTKEILILDELWHHFLLFTEEYRRFCETYLGYVIPHLPNDPSLNQRLSPQELIERNTKLEQQFKAQLQFTKEKLGERTLAIWYKVLAEKYDIQCLAEKHKFTRILKQTPK